MTTPLPSLPSTSFASAGVLGRTEPRLWTPPLRELTPDTSYGFDLIDFADDIGWPFDPWEKWLAIHMGELLEDGTPRFRILLILVARQNGKTVFTRILILYWMFIENVPMVYGTNADRGKAFQSYKEVIKIAEETPLLADELPPYHEVKQIGQEDFFNVHGSHYKFGAANSKAGRSLTVNRAIIDELREHKNSDCWDALIPAMNAVWDAQAVIITNEGDEKAEVLHAQVEAAEDFINTGVGDYRLGMFSWSSPPGSDPTDLEALAYANPNMGRRIPVDALLGQATVKKRKGGEALAKFRIEYMCQRVALLDPAIEPEFWKKCRALEPIDLADHRRRVALCLDVDLFSTHATLSAATYLDGVAHVEIVKRWNGFNCTKMVRADLPDIVEAIKPRMFGWFPASPSAVIAADLRARKGYQAWPPRGVLVEELKADQVPAICMGMADLVHSDQVRYRYDDVATKHVEQTQKLKRGDVWVFGRAKSGPIDGTYAMAGAIHLARTMPPPLAPLVVARA